MILENQPSLDDVLEHHGVKGMHWGVRKAGNSSSSSKVSYSIDKDGRISIDKGHHLQRVFQTGKGGDGSDGANYFSFTNKDNNTYKAMMGAGIDSRFSIIRKMASDKVSVMVATERLRSPSRKEAFDILQETIKSNGSSSKMKPFKGDFSNPSALSWYQDANTRIVLDKNTKLSQAYFTNLRKKNFNILLDEMDSGTIAELPIVVLDGSKSLKPLSISDLKGQDVRASNAFIKQRENRTIRSLEEQYGKSKGGV